VKVLAAARTAVVKGGEVARVYSNVCTGISAMLVTSHVRFESNRPIRGLRCRWKLLSAKQRLLAHYEKRLLASIWLRNPRETIA
jgi:hypothetical protein